MAHWKARVEFLLSVIELVFLSLTVEALQGKMCQNSLPSGGGGSAGAKISGGRGRTPANILIPLEGNRLCYNFSADSFWATISKTVPLCYQSVVCPVCL